MRNGLPNQFGNLASRAGFGVGLTRELLFQKLAHHFDPSQALTKIVVQVLPNPPLFPVADLQDFLEQLFRSPVRFDGVEYDADAFK